IQSGFRMSSHFAESWRETFLQTLRQDEFARNLRDAALQERLGDWTKTLTAAVVASCQSLGWQAAAKGHRLAALPVPNSEYLNLDVMALAVNESRWRFPVAIFELENSPTDDRVAYSLWKVLCVRAEMRVVFCYRRDRNAGAVLTRRLSDEVINAFDISRRLDLEGETLLVIGSRDESATFPNNFFRWWMLEHNTGSFRPF
ncbi:MAG: hypothetical protein ACRD9Y_11885, partial [Blastocatellia bacterium]